MTLLNVLQVDPGTHVLGVAYLSGDLVELHAVHAFKEPGALLGRTWRERLRPLLHALAMDNPVDVVGGEHPPTHGHKGRGREGSQAGIGLALGRVLGMVEGYAAEQDLPFAFVHVEAWHLRLRELEQRHNVRLPDVARSPSPFATADECRLDGAPERQGSVLVMRWRCGATKSVENKQLGRMSTACPKCGRKEVDLVRDEEAIKADQTAARVYSVARALWPRQVDAVVEDALERARAGSDGVKVKAAAPWRLVGVTDACAAGLQAYTLRHAGKAAATPAGGKGRARG